MGENGPLGEGGLVVIDDGPGVVMPLPDEGERPYKLGRERGATEDG